MRLPRRVPWTSLAELDEVCSWIYAEDRSHSSATAAINRLTAWRAMTALPHALEATLSMLSSIRLDEQCSNALAEQQMAPSGPSNVHIRMSAVALGVRQSYATAIVRMVNGLIDPLQTGMYARSIASIAAQIGLSQWLVELRHAATHEDLPSMELLRSGAQEALQWLLHNYFMPTLSPSYEEQTAVAMQLSPIAPLLKRYKAVMKLVTRDASLANQHKAELRDIDRSIERWISEAKVAAASVMFTGWGTESTEEAVEEKERWALERLCEALTQKGGIVPTSSKKRLASKSKTEPLLPQALVDVWAPLLLDVTKNHPALPAALTSVIVDRLAHRVVEAEDEVGSKTGHSYDLCLVAWCNWFAQILKERMEDRPAGFQITDLVSLILTTQGPPDDASTDGSLKILLDLLSQSDQQLQRRVHDLRGMTSRHQSEVVVDDGTLEAMEQRVKALLFNPPLKPAVSATGDVDMDERAHEKDNLPLGWSVVDASMWKPCPIGVYQ